MPGALNSPWDRPRPIDCEAECKCLRGPPHTAADLRAANTAEEVCKPGNRAAAVAAVGAVAAALDMIEPDAVALDEAEPDAIAQDNTARLREQGLAQVARGGARAAVAARRAAALLAGRPTGLPVARLGEQPAVQAAALPTQPGALPLRYE